MIGSSIQVISCFITKKKGKIECSSSVMMSSDSGMVLSINIVTVTQPQISRSECLRCQKIIHFGSGGGELGANELSEICFQ